MARLRNGLALLLLAVAAFAAGRADAAPDARAAAEIRHAIP